MAASDDGRVGSAERLDDLGRILLRGVDGVGGAELLGELQLVVDDVDGHDGAAGDLGVLHGQVAEAADAEHGDEVGRAGARRP